MTTDPADFSAYRFLIADDKAFSRSLVNGMLLRCQTGKIERATNGADAIEILSKARGSIDCVLCDWNMKPVDGLEVLRAIRGGTVPDTPRDLCFIMLTGHSQAHIVQKAIDMDTNGYVVKPVSLARLIQAVNAAFANPVSLKPEEAYLSRETVETPRISAVAKRRIPPWVILSKMPRKAKDAASRRLDEIQREVSKSIDTQSTTERPIIDIKLMDVDEIVAGKVIAEDIYNAKGALLLGAGMILTDTLLQRLRELATTSSMAIQFLVGDHGD